MPLKRVIPLLLFDGNGLVKTVKFSKPSYIGDPINAIKIYNEKQVDELVLLDINASRERRKPSFDKIADMAGETFMPFAYGGGVKTYTDFAELFRLGVEKVIVNSLIQENPAIIRKVIEDYGSQSVVGCIDYKKRLLGAKFPFSYLGHSIAHDIAGYAVYLEKEIGVGELLLQSADRDGTWEGYDEEITTAVIRSVDIPVIAAGGCGHIDHLRKVLYQCDAQAAAVGSMAVYSKKGMGVLISFPAREQVIEE
jgi:imidazole glycerol-phosphate synthase subunit HisF